MLRKAVLLTLAWMIGGSAFMGIGLCDENANALRDVEKAIRKYQRLMETGKTEKARRLAAKTAQNHPESAAAKLLLQHCQTWAQTQCEQTGLTPTVSTVKAHRSDRTETLITAQMLIVDVSDSFFEQFGVDFETILPKPAGEHFERIGIDFDFQVPESKNHEQADVMELDVQAIPQPMAPQPECLQVVFHESAAPHAVLGPLEARLLERAIAQGHCRVLSRPQVRTLPLQSARVEVAGDDDNLAVELVADVSQDGKHLALDIRGKSQNRETQLQESLPVGKTLLMSLGSRDVVAQLEHRVPVLGEIPHISRLFKHTGVVRETWHRLVFITPQIVQEPKSYPVTMPHRN